MTNVYLRGIAGAANQPDGKGGYTKSVGMVVATIRMNEDGTVYNWFATICGVPEDLDPQKWDEFVSLHGEKLSSFAAVAIFVGRTGLKRNNYRE